MHSVSGKKSLQESDIPNLASDAVRAAYGRALQSGSSVLEVVDGNLVRSKPDGTRTVIKPVQRGRKVVPGKTIVLGK